MLFGNIAFQVIVNVKAAHKFYVGFESCLSKFLHVKSSMCQKGVSDRNHEAINANKVSGATVEVK